MTTLPFTQVDAFADRPFTGNPAAVMPLEAWLDDAILQAIAMENNLAETAFTVPYAGEEADYELVWFTPAAEAEMCGHATLASGHVLLGTRDKVRFKTRHAGMLEVSRDGEGYALSLPAWAPTPKPQPDVVAVLGIDPATVVETLWHDRRYSLIVVRDEAAVRACDPDFRKLAAFGDWLTIVTARGQTAEIVSRAFAPGAGIDEDPVTGSAHAVVAPYWAGVLGKDSFTAYQASARGGYLQCRVAGDRVVLGGSCVTVIEGTMRL